MPVSKGRLDEIAKAVLDATNGKAAAVVVVTATHAARMAVQEDFSLLAGEHHLKRLPKILRHLATEIEKGNGEKTDYESEWKKGSNQRGRKR